MNDHHHKNATNVCKISKSVVSFSFICSYIFLLFQQNEAFIHTTTTTTSSSARAPTLPSFFTPGRNKNSNDNNKIHELNAVKKKSQKKSTKKDESADTTNNSISPMLAQWANTGSSSSVTKVTSESITTSAEEEEIATIPIEKKVIKKKKTPKSKTKTLSDRRTKQEQRKGEESIRKKQELKLINKLRMLLGDIKDKDENKKASNDFSVDDIVSIIDDLVENNINGGSSSTNSMRNVVAATNKDDNHYRMLWAGSDNAICHIGSGLHKVPLARLQEVFLSFFKSTIEVYEVIRIIGPFPNVKNTLKGDIVNSNIPNTANIVYTSMIDGTGKEILAGKEDNNKNVPLNVILATENVIVWKVPEGKSDNGGDFLIFIKEFDLDSRLDILRVI